MTNLDNLRLKVMSACGDEDLSLFDDLVQAARCALYDLEDVLASKASPSYFQLKSTITDLNDIFNDAENENGY